MISIILSNLGHKGTGLCPANTVAFHPHKKPEPNSFCFGFRTERNLGLPISSSPWLVPNSWAGVEDVGRPSQRTARYPLTSSSCARLLRTMAYSSLRASEVSAVRSWRTAGVALKKSPRGLRPLKASIFCAEGYQDETGCMRCRVEVAYRSCLRPFCPEGLQRNHISLFDSAFMAL